MYSNIKVVHTLMFEYIQITAQGAPDIFDQTYSFYDSLRIGLYVLLDGTSCLFVTW